MKPRILSVKEKRLEERAPPDERKYRFVETVGRRMPIEAAARNVHEEKIERNVSQESTLPKPQEKQESFFSKIKSFFRF